MAIKFFITQSGHPAITHNTDEEAVVAAFLSADLHNTPKGIEIIADKIDKIKKNIKEAKKGKIDKKNFKKETFPGECATLFMGMDEVEIRDNEMLFSEPVAYKCSFEEFVKLFRDWEDFLANSM